MSSSEMSLTNTGKGRRRIVSVLTYAIIIGVFFVIDRLGGVSTSATAMFWIGFAFTAGYDMYRAVYGYWFAEKYRRISTAVFFLHLIWVLIISVSVLLIWQQASHRTGQLMIVLGAITLYGISELRRRYEAPFLRMRLRQAMNAGKINQAKRLSLILYDRTLPRRFAQKSRSGALDFAKSAKLIGELKESVGDYRGAELFYDWAAADFLEAGLTHSGYIKASCASLFIDAFCSKVRVLRILAPQEADELLESGGDMAWTLGNPRDVAKVIMVGGEVSGLQNIASSLSGDTLSEEILRQNATSVLRYDVPSTSESCFCAYHLARHYSKRGKKKDALDVLNALNRSLTDSNDIRSFLLRIDTEELRTDLLDNSGKADDAFKVISSIIEDIEYRLNQLAEDGDEASLLSLSERASRITSRYVGLVSERFPEARERRVKSFDAILRLKGIAAKTRLGVAKALSPMLEDAYKKEAIQAANIRRDLSDAWTRPGSSGAVLEVQRLELTRLEAFLIRKRLGVNWTTVQPANNLSSLRKCLSPKERVVEFVKARYSDGADRYVCFTFTSSESDELVLLELGMSSQIDSAITEWRQLVRLGANPTLAHRATAAIQHTIISPLVKIAGTAQHLIVALDGQLGLLPLEAFFDPSGKSLIDQFEWSYIASSNDIIPRQESPRRNKARDIVFASPDFDWSEEAGASAAFKQAEQPVHQPFKMLKFAAKEGEDVAKILSADLYTGKDATVTRIKEVLGPRVLHIATHAFAFDPGPSGPKKSVLSNWERVKYAKDPMARAGLAMAGVNGVIRGESVPASVEDGVLTASEASALDLRETSLVVLSACDTGTGEVFQGEGVLGLRRAFTLAGARTVVASLWHVPDAQTHELMVSFYQKVSAGKSYADALREAKRLVRQRHPQPLFWSAFVCYGRGNESLN